MVLHSLSRKIMPQYSHIFLQTCQSESSHFISMGAALSQQRRKINKVEERKKDRFLILVCWMELL